jgi:phytoene/squalene synthetase
MEMDLFQSSHQQGSYQEYIYGSAEVVGLMCLRVFCNGDLEQYDRLKDGARSLGAAFQKVNFLRDMKSDFVDRGRVYFPGVNFTEFTPEVKRRIEDDIQKDFDAAYIAIMKLPKSARAGVYLAYIYYLNLFRKIKKASAAHVLQSRIRVPDTQKIALLLGTVFKQKLSMI